MKKEKILILGGTGTLGSSLVEVLSDNYKNILITSTKPENSNILHLNLEDESSIIKLLNVINNVNHVIFASGYEPKLNLDDFDIEHTKKMFKIHVLGPMYLLSNLKDKILSGGSITFISSVAAFKGSYDPTYAAAKGAINSLTKTLAKELAPKIRVNSIAPSLISDSKVFKGMTTDFKEIHLSASLLNKFLSPEECSKAILFLISNNHITGEILHINGGQHFG